MKPKVVFKPSQIKLIEEATAAEFQSAKDAGEIGYMARMLVQVTMPHSKPATDRFVRTNGEYTVQMIASDVEIGLPYGSIPRLVLAWLTSEAVRTKSPNLELGRSFNGFLRDVGILAEGRTASGGKRGVGKIAGRQTLALFNAMVTWSRKHETGRTQEHAQITKGYDVAWDPIKADDLTLWTSTVNLSHEFYSEIISHPVPIDMRALRMLKRSPMRLDIYCWLTWRLSYLNRETTIPWEYLKLQFGAGYGDDGQGLRDFKKAFLEALRAVQTVYTKARVQPTEGALILKPSPTHVPLTNIRLLNP